MALELDSRLADAGWLTQPRLTARRQVRARCSRTTTVVSCGTVEIVTVQAGDRLRIGDAHLLEEALQRMGSLLVVTERHRDDEVRIEPCHQLRGARRRQGTADRDAGDLDRADLAQHLLRQHVADVAQVDGVQAIQLEHERGVEPALGALGVVAVRAHARDEHLVDLVLAGRIDGERALEAGGSDDTQHGRAQRARRAVIAARRRRSPRPA